MAQSDQRPVLSVPVAQAVAQPRISARSLSALPPSHLSPGPVPAAPGARRDVPQGEDDPVLTDFNPYPPIPQVEDRLKPLDCFLLGQLDWVGQINPMGTGAVARAYACDPLTADGKSELTATQLTQCAVDLVATRRGDVNVESLPMARIVLLLRFVHIEYKDQTSAGLDKALTRFREQCLATVQEVALLSASTLAATSVFALWFHMAVLPAICSTTLNMSFAL